MPWANMPVPIIATKLAAMPCKIGKKFNNLLHVQSKTLTMKPFLVTKFIITGDLNAAAALTAVTAIELPKYR